VQRDVSLYLGNRYLLISCPLASECHRFVRINYRIVGLTMNGRIKSVDKFGTWGSRCLQGRADEDLYKLEVWLTPGPSQDSLKNLTPLAGDVTRRTCSLNHSQTHDQIV